MKVICISDTHNRSNLPAIPDGDVLIHAGDATMMGTETEVRKFADWMSWLPHERKLFVPGNHDFMFEHDYDYASRIMADVGVDLLVDRSLTIGDYKFYGSPWVPNLPNWAFSGVHMPDKWALIPDDTDVLITHGPPRFILDQVTYPDYVANYGCPDLANRVLAARPKLHVFGHIHDSHGQTVNQGTLHVNAAICDERYRPSNKPIEVDL